jgi:hypothetical protein
MFIIVCRFDVILYYTSKSVPLDEGPPTNITLKLDNIALNALDSIATRLGKERNETAIRYLRATPK